MSQAGRQLSQLAQCLQTSTQEAPASFQDKAQLMWCVEQAADRCTILVHERDAFVAPRMGGTQRRHQYLVGRKAQAPYHAAVFGQFRTEVTDWCRYITEGQVWAQSAEAAGASQRLALDMG